MTMSLLEQVLQPNISRELINDVSSAVLGYCITAAFLVRNRQKQVMPSHFLKMLAYLDQPSISFTNMETASDTFDLIRLSTNLRPEVAEYIRENLSDRSYPEFALVRSIIKFINTDREFISLVESVTNNGVQNNIEIDVEELNVLAGQGTSIRIDNMHVNILQNFMPMVKSGASSVGIGQADLINDYGYDAQRRFIKNNLGVDIGYDSAVYYQTCHNNGNPSAESIENATRDLYTKVSDKLNQGFNGSVDAPNEDFKANTIDCLMRECMGANGGTDGVCVQLDNKKVGYSSFTPSKVFEKLYGKNLRASCKSRSQGNPCLMITDVDSGDLLFKTRFKKESYPDNLTGHRYKLYFEPNRKLLK